jgi:hypothetical protein
MTTKLRALVIADTDPEIDIAGTIRKEKIDIFICLAI